MEQMIDEEGIEYKIFTWSFIFSKIAGVWLPTTIKQRRLRWCYYAYSILCFIGLFTAYFGMSYIIISNNVVFIELVNNWYMIAVATHIHIRGMNVTRNRARIIRFLREKIIVKRWTNLRDAEEIAILDSARITEQDFSFYWMIAVMSTAAFNVLNPIISKNPNNDLIFLNWTPCDVNVRSCFWILWVGQASRYMLAAITQVATDCILLNSIQRICTHFRILQHRLAIFTNLVSEGVLNTAEKERRYLIECILDHQNIYDSISDISQMFNVTTFIHFALSFSSLCTNTYLLSKQPLFTSDFFAVSSYLCIILIQNFIHCWYGYQLTQIGNEIVYTIFSMNWLELRSESRNVLRFIMLFASKNISLFNNCILELSPQMFLKILKLSYSAFNLLQTRY